MATTNYRKNFMKNKILCVGPLPPPYNGQAVAFSYLKGLKSTQNNFNF